MLLEVQYKRSWVIFVGRIISKAQFVGYRPGFSASGSTFDGSTCVTTPPLASGSTFTVEFPTVGNYKLVCLVHEDMTGTIHVLDTSVPLPHDQAYYDKQAAQQAQELLSTPDLMAAHTHNSAAGAVAVGIGKVVANPGGHETVSIMRFVEPELVIHAGATVEWTNRDPITPHTIHSAPSRWTPCLRPAT